MASLALAVAGTLAGGAAATAAPDDPVVFADQGLEDAVNDALGQSPGETITEAQAAGLSVVDAASRSVTDLAGIEYLTGLATLTLDNNEISDLSSLSGLTSLTTLSANNNSITDLSALSNLTSLVSLEMYGNAVTSVSALQGLTNLQYVNLSDSDLTDISALSGLTNLLYLVIDGNSITDISPLSGLTGLQMLVVTDQSIDMSATPAGVATTNPLVDLAGASIPVTSTDADFAYDATTQAWTFTTRGTKSMTWTIPLTMGATALGEFSGTISQRITPTQVAPVDPEVVPATCLDGDITAPQIILPDTEGIIYSIDGDVVPGATVTVEATLADDEHAIYVDPASDWVDVGGDHFYATLEITLASPDCSATVTPQEPDVVQAICSDGELSAATITLPTTDGIAYAIDGTVAPGETVTVQALPADGQRIVVDPATGWVADSDRTSAELVLTLDEVDCEPVIPTPTVIDPPNGDLPMLDPCGADNATWVLPTGDDVSEGFSWVVNAQGLLTAVAHDGYAFSAASADADPILREYGYPPDANEPCQVGTDDPHDASTLAATGSAGAAGGIAAAALLGVGGLLLLLAGRRRKELLTAA